MRHPLLPRSPVRGRAALLAGLAVLLVACDGAAGGPDDPSVDDGTATTDETSPPTPDGPDPTVPAVALLDVDEVDRDAAPGTLDGDIAEVAAGLPADWVVAVVADPELGPYVVGVPPGTVVWRAGDEVDALATVTDDTAWGRYWLPIAEEVTAGPDGASLRSILVLDELLDGDDVAAVQVNVTGVQDLPVDDPQATAERFAASFEDQGLEVEAVGVTTVGEDEVGAVRSLTPDDEFDDGVARRLEQWFHPEAEAGLLWSLVCDAPVTRAEEVATPCATMLASFRPPRR